MAQAEQDRTPEPLTLWRISFYEALDGIGALRGGGRWNSRGRATVYLAESPAGAMLETLVHLPLDESDWPERYRLLCIEVVGSVEVAEMVPAGDAWREDLKITQQLGDAWLAGRESALTRVPSAILPFTWNYLLNPAHPDAAKARVVGATEQLYDPRLLAIRGGKR